MAKKSVSMQAKITKIDVTAEKVSGRGGIFFFLRYVENIIFYSLFERYFGCFRASAKGLPIYQFIKQLLAHFIDGTDMSMSSSDRLKEDESYAAVLENVPGQMASSHQIKCVFSKLAYVGNRVYRVLLHQLFIWRLKIEKPSIIILFGDSGFLDDFNFRYFEERLKSWTKFRRCIFTTLETEQDGQHYILPESIIKLNHQRGKGELVHRSLKEFATKEQLPFERFGMNRAYYYFLVISHFLYEAFKHDVLEDVVHLSCYPNTFRRAVTLSLK